MVAIDSYPPITHDQKIIEPIVPHQALKEAIVVSSFLLGNFLCVAWLSTHWTTGSRWLDFLILTIVTSILYRTEIYPRFVSGLRHVPRATGGFPLLGHGAAQFLHPRGERLMQMTRSIPNSGLIYFQGFWGADNLLLTNPEALAEVLVRRPYVFTKPPPGANLIRRFIGDSLFVAEGDVHRHLRKTLQPFFSFRKIRDLRPIFWEKGIKLTQAVIESAPRNSGHESTVEVSMWANKATMDSIGEAALGKDFNTLNETNELIEAVEMVGTTKIGLQMVFIATAMFLPRWALSLVPGGIEQRLSAASSRFRQLCTDFINDSKKRVHGGADAKDIFGQIIQSDYFDDHDLIDNLLMIIATGQDPTAATFTWVLYYLATQPHWQERLRHELQSAIEHKSYVGVEPRLDDGDVLEGLPVLNAVCNETLRYMPTTPVTSRVAGRDTTIMDVPVSKGTKILIAPWTLNRSVSLYGPTAEEFDPTRWIDADGKPNNHGGASTNFAFSTFLHGPRRCIGMEYAKGQIRAFVAAFVGRLYFEMAEPGEVIHQSGMFATRPREGLKLKIREVEAW